jgi:hypothetical protein
MLRVKKSYLVICILALVALTTGVAVFVVFEQSTSAVTPAFLDGKIVAIRAPPGSDYYYNADKRALFVSIPQLVMDKNPEIKEVLDEADSLFEVWSKYPANFLSKPDALASVDLNEIQTTRLLSVLPSHDVDTEEEEGGGSVAMNHYFKIGSDGILYDVGILTMVRQ